MEHIDKCWYRNVCTKDGQYCTNCVRFLEMSALMEQSNIPINRQIPDALYPEECDIASFQRLAEIKTNILEFAMLGKNLYITSETTGNGKTSWAIKLLLKYFNDVWAGNGFKCRGVFIHVPTFLNQQKNFEWKDYDFKILKDNIVKPSTDIVVWDDIASTDMSSYDYSQLLAVIDHRILYQQSNIFTGNLSGSMLEKKLGAKLYSRIEQSSEVIKLRGADNRNGFITDNI